MYRSLHALSYILSNNLPLQLDNFVYQLITLSFLLSPSFLPYAFRTLFQFQFSRPRDLDPHRSLRFWYALILLFHGLSVWSHAVEGAAHGRSIILDFVGQCACFFSVHSCVNDSLSYAPASPPSKIHLVLLDFAIIILNMILTSISYETLNGDDATDPLLPTTPPYVSSPTMFTTSDHPSKENPYVLDLRIAQIIHRLRNPAPPPPTRINPEALLPLPISTPWRLPAQLQALMSNRVRTRERNRQRDETTTQVQGEGRNSPPERRTVPGGLDSADVT